MNKQLLIVIAAAAALGAGGCAKKRPPMDASQVAPGVNPDRDGSNPDSLAALQADLAARAGSDRVLFALDSSGIDASARAILDRQASWLRQHPTVNFLVEGHCDERGTREYNLALGQRRANAAAAYLVSLGIAAERISTISYGKERPDALGSDDRSLAANRRAVSIVVQR